MTALVWGAVQRDVSALLDDPPDDVPAVVRRLTELQCLLDGMPPAPGRNPIADFNRLYLRITTGVLERLYAGSFADPAFLARLDVEFAARYFDAVRAWSEARPCCPQVWSVLFGRIAGPVPSAAAGINAHINFDLPFALVTTFDQLGSDPLDDSDQHRDYLQINDIFAGAIPGLRRGYLDRWQVLIETMNGDLDDWWQGEAVTYARNVAWRHAQKLWAMRHDLPATADERARLDGHAAALSRLLLSPLSAVLQ
jgi:Family of unknown function (DUF5995)